VFLGHFGTVRFRIRAYRQVSGYIGLKRFGIDPQRQENLENQPAWWMQKREGQLCSSQLNSYET